ncbi:hypothetical protein [Streptomyces hebeiensis]
MTDPISARQNLVDHPHYRYRGCAPDPDQPRMSAADPDVPVDAWGPYTGDGAEPQADRHAREKAARAICGRCPVLTVCRIYANTTVRDEDGVEHLTEPEGILGGELALARHRALIARRHAATVTDGPAVRDVSAARTPQRRALLRALARETDAELVAHRVGMTMQAANWHRSALVGILGLDRERATRDQLLAAAVEHGLLPRSVRIVPDGRWPVAAAPTMDGIRQRRISRGRPVQLVLPGMEDMRRHPSPARAGGRTSTADGGRGRAHLLRIVRPDARPLLLPLPPIQSAHGPTGAVPVLEAAA